jgi:hypothetical protein
MPTAPKGERRKRLGASEKQDRRWQALAAVPEAVFEKELAWILPCAEAMTSTRPI